MGLEYSVVAGLYLISHASFPVRQRGTADPPEGLPAPEAGSGESGIEDGRFEERS